MSVFALDALDVRYIVRYIPTALTDPDAHLARLELEIHWVDGMRARRTASYGRPYNYSGQTYPVAPMPPTLATIAKGASTFAGHSFDNCLCNLYETGRNSMGFHSDSYEDLDPTSQIAIVSLGAARTIVFRSVDSRKELLLEHGSLLLMDRAIQETWMHAIPRDPTAGRRISLTFRRFSRA